jgi:hypothetical protein
LLAPLLLVCKDEKMKNNEYVTSPGGTVRELEHDAGDAAPKNQQFSSSHTSNDLWSRLKTQHPARTMNYEVVAQSAAEVRDLRNAPALTMADYLVESGQTQLLTTISVYTERGKSSDQLRLLYMNACALRVWKTMGRNPTMIGARHRPPSTALLMYGVPFSE